MSFHSRLQVTPHPPIVRGLDLVINKLRQAGHIVVKWQGPLRTGDLLDIGGEFTLSGARDDSGSIPHGYTLMQSPQQHQVYQRANLSRNR